MKRKEVYFSEHFMSLEGIYYWAIRVGFSLETVGRLTAPVTWSTVYHSVDTAKSGGYGIEFVCIFA